VTVVAPIASYAKPIPLGSDFLLELSPLPSAAEAAVFTELGARGAAGPTFYFGGPGVENAASGTVGRGETITVGSAVSIGATLGPFALAPREWARVLREAMAAAGESDLGPWTAFENALGTGQALYVLRHTGQPPGVSELRFDVELPDGTSDIALIDDRGDLSAVANGNLFAPGARVRLRTNAAGVPYHTAYDADLRSSAEHDATADDRWFEPSAFAGEVGTILCTDLNGWFGARPAGSPLPRWHTGNRVEPLLDGIEYFARLWRDLQPLRTTIPTATTDGTHFGAWMAGLGFKDFELVPGVPESRFVDLVKELDGREIEVRLLGAKGFIAEIPDDEVERAMLAIALVLVIAGIGVASEAFEGLGFGMSDVAWSRLTLVAIIGLILASTQFVDLITDKLDFSKAVFAALTPAAANEPRFALWSRYPARFSDNPAADYPAAVVEGLVSVERTGFHHMKIGVLSLPAADPAVPIYVAYVGGIDINANRIDSWAHRWPPNYHDLHARVSGPVAADVFQTFYERWEDELDRLPAAEGPAAPNGCPRFSPRPGSNHPVTASLSAIPTAGDHVVQIARTLYRPAAANTNEGFWYAPQGEASVHDSVLRAIQSAHEYIYIEDQYMTPADSGGEGAEIMEALVSAATRCKALILVFSQGTAEQLFGNERRNALFGQLQTAWAAQPGRVFLPMIHSRQLLGPPDNVSAKGRTVLKQPVAAAATQVRVADGLRVPDAPCWAWIEGELVLVQDVDRDTATNEAALVVARAPAKHLDSSARAHEAGAPVTFVTLDDVFIHAKVVLVDDVYASIGSANMNRRSMFHDGEMNAMVVPGRLRAAADNPVRSIRCRLWADHLGLPPQLAESELADPIAALKHFERPRAAGNLLTRFDLFDDMGPDGIEIQTKDAIEILQTVFSGLGQVGGDIAKAAIWRTLIDPTTSLDPFPDAPPFP
jgi:phosphatidylserine/phosphatidylglycerophosphate/cardiolipin synthase-like enzyme